MKGSAAALKKLKYSEKNPINPDKIRKPNYQYASAILNYVKKVRTSEPINKLIIRKNIG